MRMLMKCQEATHCDVIRMLNNYQSPETDVTRILPKYQNPHTVTSQECWSSIKVLRLWRHKNVAQSTKAHRLWHHKNVEQVYKRSQARNRSRPNMLHLKIPYLNVVYENSGKIKIVLKMSYGRSLLWQQTELINLSYNELFLLLSKGENFGQAFTA